MGFWTSGAFFARGGACSLKRYLHFCKRWLIELERAREEFTVRQIGPLKKYANLRKSKIISMI